MNALAKSKAQQGMDLMTKQCIFQFKKEWGNLVQQHKQMRNALYTSEQSLFLCEAKKAYMESEFTALKLFTADKIFPNPVPPYYEGFMPEEGEHK